MICKELFTHYPELEVCRADIDALLSAMEKTAKRKGKILLCGNGGSAADCDHIVGELMKDFAIPRPLPEGDRAALSALDGGERLAAGLQRAVPAISLPAQAAVLSAFANDRDPELVYAQLTYGYGAPGDLFLGISTSGNSKNVVAAAKTARAMGLTVAALTGERPSALSEVADVAVRVPATETYRVQEYHLPVYHALCAALEAELFGK